MTHLITGYAGKEHIKSEDQGSFNASFFGGGQYVMESGNEFEASITSNNNVRVLDGDLLMYGRHVRANPDTYEDLTITTGTAGKNRIDLICMTYEKNLNTGIENAFLEVIKGTETSGTPKIPAYVDGNILQGASFNQMPLYKVTINGVALTSIERIFATIPTYKKLAAQYAAQFQSACETYLGALNILDTMEEVEANTQGKQLAGALAVKETIASTNKRLNDINTNLLKVKHAVFSFQCAAGYSEKDYDVSDEIITTQSLVMVIPTVAAYSTAGMRPSIALPNPKAKAGKIWIDVANAGSVTISFICFYK